MKPHNTGNLSMPQNCPSPEASKKLEKLEFHTCSRQRTAGSNYLSEGGRTFKRLPMAAVPFSPPPAPSRSKSVLYLFFQAGLISGTRLARSFSSPTVGQLKSLSTMRLGYDSASQTSGCLTLHGSLWNSVPKRLGL